MPHIQAAAGQVLTQQTSSSLTYWDRGLAAEQALTREQAQARAAQARALAQKAQVEAEAQARAAQAVAAQLEQVLSGGALAGLSQTSSSLTYWDGGLAAQQALTQALERAEAHAAQARALAQEAQQTETEAGARAAQVLAAQQTRALQERAAQQMWVPSVQPPQRQHVASSSHRHGSSSGAVINVSGASSFRGRQGARTGNSPSGRSR
ncbi:hypothetical protein AB0I54_44650 [Streptomyces sp. NPDC050625]|uniref:hypothetical protein n=1 Tax=Streptomyces sp. NPDC050625 TaxID=3154629 RepID=UPI00342D66EF